MSDSFIAFIRVGHLAESVDPWRVVGEVEQLMEAAMWSVWSETNRSYSADTDTNVEFTGSDVVNLKERFKRHGGRLQRIEVQADYRKAPDISVWATVHPPYPSQLVQFYVNGANRVDVDAVCNALVSGLESFRRRKAWREASVKREDTYVSSRADEGHQPSTSPVIRARGLWSSFRRWMIRNRDGIIVGLACSTVVSLIFAAAAWFLPK
jgi:major membrane immunogen (membrane-anchored lipoprotein)